MNGHILAITSQKGGTGKTTTAINLATSLALLEQRTLLVDCDPQGSATTGLGIDKRRLKHNLFHAMVGRAPVRDIIVDYELDLLKVIPARLELMATQAKLSAADQNSDRLRRLIHCLSDQFDFIIIDAPPALGFLTLCAIVAADWLVVPIQPRLYAIEGVGQLMQAVQQLRHRRCAHARVAGLLFTMLGAEDKIDIYHRRNDQDINQRKFFRTTIPWDNALRNSSDVGRPVSLIDAGSKGAEAYFALAVELMRSLSSKHHSARKGEL